ncbi:MAG: ferritin-like domain-containing protein, partial [Minicystis sp.]
MIDEATRARLAGALSTFTRETTLGPEHRRLMDSGHRPIPWAESTAHTLSPTLRQGLGELWRARMISEHRSVGIFALYALDLLGAGAPAEALSLACRAALDEVRHAELFARLAALYTGEPETPPPGIPAMPDDPRVSMRFQVAREALHLCVCAETYSAVTLVELHHRATDPAVHAALGVVIADELHHARMGWSLLALLLAEPDTDDLRASLQAEIVPMLDGFARDMFGDPTQILPPSLTGADRALAEAHGYLSQRDEYTLFRATIDE